MVSGSTALTHPSLPVRRRRRRGGAAPAAPNLGALRVDFEAPIGRSWRSTGRRGDHRAAVDVAGVTLPPSAAWQQAAVRNLIGQ